MDFLNKSIAQLSDLFRSMTPGAGASDSLSYLFRFCLFYFFAATVLDSKPRLSTKTDPLPTLPPGLCLVWHTNATQPDLPTRYLKVAVCSAREL